MATVTTNVRPSETTIPGLTRRRVWANPDVRSHSLVVLTMVKLHLAPPAGTPRPELVQALDQGGDVEALLGPLSTVIELRTITRVRLNLLTNGLVVEYRADGVRPGRTVISMATAEEADALFTKLWRRLGEGFDLIPYQPDPWTTARGPVAVLAGIAVATAGLALLASAAADIFPPGSLLTQLDWRVIGGVGGAMMAVVQVWMYRRWTAPPARLEIARV